MKYLHLKIAIGIVVVFGLLFLGMALYLPLWYRVQCWRLHSSDKSVRESAAQALAAEGRRAMPHIKKWLASQNDAQIIDACLILKNMKGDTWRKALPDIERILDGTPSIKTDAAAAVLDREKFAWDYYSGDTSVIHMIWNRYKENPVRRRNICCYLLRHASDSKLRLTAASNLAKKKPHNAVILHLIEAMKNDKAAEVRRHAAFSLGEIEDDDRVTDALVEIILNDTEAKSAAANSFKPADTRAVMPLIKALRENSDGHTRSAAALAFVFIQDTRAVKPLIYALENDTHAGTRKMAAFTLGNLRDKRALEPLLNVAANDPDDKVRIAAVEGLRYLNDPGAIEPLEAVLKKNESKVLCDKIESALYYLRKRLKSDKTERK